MSGQKPENFSRRVYALLLGIGVVTVCALLAVLYLLTEQIDRNARETARDKHEILLDERKHALSLAVEDYAYWTLAFRIIRDGDAEQVYENLGSGATESELFDWMWILDADGTTLFTYTSEGFPDPVEALNQDHVQPLLAVLRETRPEDYVSASGYVQWGDGISSAAAAWVTPDDLSEAEDGRLPILLVGKTFDAAALADLALVTSAEQLAVSQRLQIGADDSVSLSGPAGDAGWLTWLAPTPGRALREDFLPSIVLVCIIVLGISLLVARYMRRMAQHLNKAILLAWTDDMTGLMNRAGLHAALHGTAMRKALDEGRVAVMSVDLNRLKHLNDTYGHKAGDRAIQIIAERLRNTVRSEDHVARIGGDEFVCVIRDDNPHDAAVHVALRFADLCDEPVDLGEVEEVLHSSVGIGIGARGTAFDTLLEWSDAAMYRAKRLGAREPTIIDAPITA